MVEVPKPLPLPAQMKALPAGEAPPPPPEPTDGIAQGELPQLFLIGPQGDGQLVNYRFRSPYYVLDRLCGAAELHLGGGKGAKGEVVRIERTDGESRAVAGSSGS